MRTKLLQIVFMMLATITLAGVKPVCADTFLKSVLRTGPVVIMEQEMPGQVDTATTWIAADKAYQSHGDGTASLYHSSDSVFYLIDHGNRSVFVVDLTEGMDFAAMMGVQMSDTNEAGQPLSEAEKREQEEAIMQASLLAQSMMESATVSVEATDETKTFGTWEAKKYTMDFTIAGMQSTGELWAAAVAPEIYKAYQRLAYSQMAASPGFHRLLEELAEIEGVTVYSKNTMTIMGVNMDVETELLEMSEADAPEGIYELPADYTVTSRP